MTGDVDVIVDTLAPAGPYGYTIRQQYLEDGSLRIPVLTTRQEIYDEYKVVRGLSDILGHIGVVDIRTPWYLFHDSINLSKRRSDGRIAEQWCMFDDLARLQQLGVSVEHLRKVLKI